MTTETRSGVFGRIFPPWFNPLATKPPFDGSRLDLRDPDWFKPYEPILAYLYEHFWRVKLTGWEHVPPAPALYVGNHNGGLMVPEMFMLQYAWWKHFGQEQPLYGLAHDVLFGFPLFKEMFVRGGAVKGSREMAHRVFHEAKGNLLVYPGGVEEMHRNFKDRNRICFQGRKGFLKLALREQVPIVPVVAAGSHEQLVVLWEGRPLAKLLGLPQLFRTHVFPLHLSLPLGVALGPIPILPLPVQVDIAFGQPIHLEGGPEDADDPVKLQHHYDRVVAAMQVQLDAMAAVRPGPPILGGFARPSDLLPFLKRP